MVFIDTVKETNETFVQVIPNIIDCSQIRLSWGKFDKIPKSVIFMFIINP